MLKFLVLVLATTGAEELEHGSLRISTQPAVEVYWEGTPLGRTDPRGDMRIEGIPPGTYGLELAGTGWRTLAVEVDVVPGFNTLAVQLDSAVRSSAGARVLPQQPSVGPVGDAEPPVPDALEPRSPRNGIATGAESMSRAGQETGPPEAPSVAAVGEPSSGVDDETEETAGALGTRAVLIGALVFGAVVVSFMLGRSRSSRRRRRRSRRSRRARKLRREPGIGASGEGGVIGEIRDRERALENLGVGGSRPIKDIGEVEVIEVPGKDPVR